MNEKGSLFDVPLAAIGRYLVRQPLGTGTTGPVFQGIDPETQAPVAIKLFKVDVSPAGAHDVAQALALLVDQTPRHAALIIPLDAGLDEIEAFLVTAFVEGNSLDSALRDYGPAAIEDLVPRLRSLAEALDAAHGAGLVHGALHPRDILISTETTHVTGVGVAPILARVGVALPVRRPYSAPEVAKGAEATAAADRFSLAAVTFEWLFGRRISGPAERLVEVRALPGVDRVALSNAFTIALAPEAGARFGSCRAFCEAVASSVAGGASATVPDFRDQDDVPLRLEPPVALNLLDEAMIASRADDDEDPVGLFMPEQSKSRFESIGPEKRAERFGGGALIVTLVVGLAVGFAAGYMAKPRALQSRPTQEMSPAAGTDASVAPAPAPVAPAPKAPSNAGRLLVRSTPSGATVQVDGVIRGVTPLALRDLELGSRAVVVARRGYIAEDRRVVLTRARPSRSFEIRLTAESPEPAPRPGTPATLGRPAAAATGTLAVESRPSGAVVTINGRPSGTTPLSLDALAPGEYRVSMALQGYRPFSTTVRVVAGERTRAAASLSAQEQE